VGSNPTPRAYLKDSSVKLLALKEGISYGNTILTLQETYLKDQPIELEAKINCITQYSSKPYFRQALGRLASVNEENANVICDYILVEQTDINIKESTKEGKIKVLIWLSNYVVNKPFSQMTKQDILGYLNSLKKPISEDPTHKWIGSYNGRQMILNKFFRWLYNPNEPNSKKRLTPPCMQGIKKLPRQENSPYKPSYLWDAREHAIMNYRRISTKIHSSDFKIIRTLLSNPRMQVGDIAKETSLSTKTITRRLEKLREDRVLQFSVSTNMSSMQLIGYIEFAVIAHLHDDSHYQQVLERIYQEMQESLFAIPHANQKEGIFLVFFCPNIPTVDLILRSLESCEGVNGTEMFITTKLAYYQDWVRREIDRKLKSEEEVQLHQQPLATQ
jgi:DNA-binding Lrp family transcriptional regulator